MPSLVPHQASRKSEEQPKVTTSGSEQAAAKQRVGATERGTVVMVIASFPPLVGGAEIQAERLALGMSIRGWKVHVITRLPSGALARLPRHESRGGVEIDRVPSRLPGKLGSIQFLLGALLRIRTLAPVSVYHAHDVGTPGIIALLARRCWGGATVVKLRTGSQVYRRTWGSGVGRSLFRTLLRSHDRVAVVSSELAELAVQCGVDQNSILKAPNFVDTSQFRPTVGDEGSSDRSGLGLPGERAIVLYVGRMEPVKGVDVLLDAWNRLPVRTRASAHLVLVGDGGEAERLRAWARELGIQESVTFVGPSSNVERYYRAADLFVLPSRAEGLSNALLEAMASELPVIATIVGGAPDLVVEGESGRLVAPQDPKALSGALRSLLEHPEAWREMGGRGKKTVEAAAGLVTMLSRWDHLYLELHRSEFQ